MFGIDSEIRIRFNLTNILIERNRRKAADAAFGIKICVYFPTSFIQFSKANMVNQQNSILILIRNFSFQG